MCFSQNICFQFRLDLSKVSGSLFGHSQYLGNLLHCAIDQYCQLRDSTDFETQLYLCNEAFKVWTVTPFNSSKATKYLSFTNLTFKAQTLKHIQCTLYIQCNGSGKCQNTPSNEPYTLEIKSRQRWFFRCNFDITFSGWTGTPTTDSSHPLPCRPTWSLPALSSAPSWDPPCKGGARHKLQRWYVVDDLLMIKCFSRNRMERRLKSLRGVRAIQG